MLEHVEHVRHADAFDGSVYVPELHCDVPSFEIAARTVRAQKIHQGKHVSTSKRNDLVGCSKAPSLSEMEGRSGQPPHKRNDGTMYGCHTFTET